MDTVTHSPLWVLLVWAEWYLAPILALVVSAVYFATSPRTQPLSLRLLVSSAGVLTAVVYCVAGAVALLKRPDRAYGSAFAVALLLPISAMVLSLWLYRGKKVVHFLQIVNVACLAWTAFIGGMAVTGDWL
jgi:uncharacterized membrane protein